MAHLNPQVIGRSLDGEGRAEIINIAKLTLSNAAASAGDVVRFAEYDADVTALQNRVDTLESHEGMIDQIYVDTTSADLATAVAAGTFDGTAKTWTFDGKVLTTGDVLILNNATEQDSDRTWILNGTNGGTVADFTAMGSDIDAAITAAIAALKGDAANAFDTLGKIEDQHIALADHVTTAEGEIDVLQAGQALRPELRTFTGTFGAPDVDGVYTATIPHSFNSTKLHIELQNDLGGAWEYVDSAVGFVVKVDAVNIVVTTESSTLASHSLRAVVTGIVGL